MALLKFFLYLIIMLIFVIAGLVFSFRNSALINLDLLFIQSANFSVGFWLLSTLLLGFILGAISTLPKRIFQNIKLHQLRKNNKENAAPLARLKHESNKGS